MNLVSIITVNFNHYEVTEELLQSIYSVKTEIEFETIVIDNGSKINRVPDWEKKYPYVKFIRSEINLGFAGGNNLGIEASKGNFLFLANNDTEFTDGLMDLLAGTLIANSEVGLVSPKIKYFHQPDTLQYVGFTKMNYFTARNLCLGQFEKDNGQYDELSSETAFGHGAAMMVRKEALNKAGLMAENYFLYYEEMDWCEHIRKAGYKIWVNLKAVIYHKESISVGKNSALKEYFMNRNRILFIRRNCTLKYRLLFWCYFLTVVSARNILIYIKNKQFEFIGVFIRAIIWNITNDTNSKNLGYKI